MAAKKNHRKEVAPGASPISGTIPPAEHRFPLGVSGNPAGRPPNAGLTVIELVNDYAKRELTEDELRAIARNKKLSFTKRAAAERAIRMFEAGDLADFAGLLRGENNLEDLRGMGINTEVVKKFKQKTRKVMVGSGGDGGADPVMEEVIEREIELHDRAGADFDRILNRTNGLPTQPVEINGTGLPTSVTIITPLTSKK